MKNITDMMKLRILIFFFKAGKSEVTVTGLAKTYGIGKYTVSRIISSLEADGLIDKTNPRSPTLTEEGRAVAKHYSNRVDTVMRGLRLKGVALEQAQTDAFYIAMYLSDETYETVRKMERMRRMKHGLEAMRQFSGDLLRKKLGDGIYSFPYILYGGDYAGGSLAAEENSLFVHPCKVEIRGSSGTVHIWYQALSTKRQIQRAEYFSNGKYYLLETVGDVLQFPLSELRFENSGTLIYGYIPIRFTLMNKQNTLEEREEIFTMFL